MQGPIICSFTGVLKYVFPLLLASLLGIGDGVLNTQLSALLALLFKRNTVMESLPYHLFKIFVKLSDDRSVRFFLGNHKFPVLLVLSTYGCIGYQQLDQSRRTLKHIFSDLLLHDRC